ncbi:TIGR03619 family F420-dependent LLM class oxidoreductase [Pseudofrankia inefficax]|uniref:Putative F420-dependent oxidoreductase n=1 Tax=Pseudofrankia inefficax (strain DSM 45817 / CECT 9037 / DDB 130130 / EuI1c) TaxID=298654 RepID=E3J5K2_PSEI1|nr:TIGR03619 family F420-dependent LLM class oxidoreductase [Pseudofrankia inefficax]ADP83089.1 putative F420-dependent oxidoreductase [Pseudofrankia inefficax]
MNATAPQPAPLPAPGSLAFGLQLPVQAQSTLFAEPWERAAGPAELAAVAVAADEAGFDYVGVCDHVAIPQRLAPAMGTVWYDTVATLGWLAARTTSTRLLSHVFNITYRHPLLTAKAFATLDALSGGRVILGAGAGHVPEEFAALGVDFARRGRLLDAGLAGVAAALRDEFPTVAGSEILGLDGSLGQAPRPVQSPRPPIWVGGSSPAAVRRAARYEGWLPQGTPRGEMRPLVELFAKERAAAGLEAPAAIGTVTEWLYVGDPGWDVDRPCVSGAPARLAENLREYAALGVTHLQVRFPSRTPAELVDQVAAFGAEVGPLLAP